jgi:hypothetical protein
MGSVQLESESKHRLSWLRIFVVCFSPSITIASHYILTLFTNRLSTQRYIFWHMGPLLYNAQNTHVTNNTGPAFSVVRARTVTMQRTLSTFPRTRWSHTTVEKLCFLLSSVPGGYKGQQRRCFLCGPRHDQCWAAGHQTRILICDVFSVLSGTCRKYIREPVWTVKLF